MRKLLFVLSVVSIFMYSCTSGEANNQEKTSPETTIAPGEVEFKTTDNGNATSDFPEIKFETESLDLGSMIDGETKLFKFHFTNTFIGKSNSSSKRTC